MHMRMQLHAGAQGPGEDLCAPGRIGGRGERDRALH